MIFGAAAAARRRHRVVESFVSAVASRGWLLRTTAPYLCDLSLQRFFEIESHHDGGLDRGAEERDEIHPHRNREVVAQQPQQKDATRHANGTVSSTLPRRAPSDTSRRAEEDDDERDRDDDLQPLSCAHLVLVAAAPVDEIPGGSGTRDVTPPCVVDEAAEVGALHVINTVAMSSPFSDEIMPAARLLDVRDLCQRKLLARRVATSTLPAPARPRGTRGVAHRTGNRAGLRAQRQIALANGRANHILHRRHRDPNRAARSRSTRTFRYCELVSGSRRRLPLRDGAQHIRDLPTICSSVGNRSVNLTPTSDRMPVDSMSILLMIGIVQML